MQNKPKVKSARIDLNAFLTNTCVKMDNWSNQTNKPNQTQFNPEQTQYKPNLKPTPIMNITIGNARDYKNKTAVRRQRANPNKPKSPKFALTPSNNAATALIKLIRPLLHIYNPTSKHYHSPCERGCSSLTAHSFQGAGRGLEPPIGFIVPGNVIYLNYSGASDAP
jgi:hypothetical protein